MEIRIEGHDLPGREFSCDGVERDNVHVAVQVAKEPFGSVPGDAPDAAWSVEVRVVPTPEGLDLRGPAVTGGAASASSTSRGVRSPRAAILRCSAGPS